MLLRFLLASALELDEVFDMVAAVDEMGYIVAAFFEACGIDDLQ